jgi:hypothetical protein
MRIGGLDRFFQVNVNTLATIPLKGILVNHTLYRQHTYFSFIVEFMISQRQMLCKTGIPEMSVFNITL